MLQSRSRIKVINAGDSTIFVERIRDCRPFYAVKIPFVFIFNISLQSYLTNSVSITVQTYILKCYKVVQMPH